MAIRTATIRIYFDADVLGLANLLCRERADFTFPATLVAGSRNVNGQPAQ
jgi:hypothetical protein